MRGGWVAAVFCVMAAARAAVAATPGDEILRRLEAGQAQAAWTLAQQAAAVHAGDPEFDYAAGRAALEAGQPQHAVMALERVLLLRPQQHRARIELARAYFLLGDYAAARREFRAVDSAAPPVNVRRRIDAFLGEIERRESAARLQMSGYVELRPGWDSNVAAAHDESFEVPALANLPVASAAVSDRFLDKNAGVTVARPLDKQRAVFADVAYRDRENVSTQAYDTRSIGLTAGMAWAQGSDRVRLPVQYQVLYLANREFRRLFSVGAEWSRDLDADDQVQLFGQIGGIRYPDEALRNVDLLLAGAGWTHRHAGMPLLSSASAYVGDESARRSGGDPNGRVYYGARIGAQWSGLAAHTPYANLTWQRSGYDAINAMFRRTRDEEFAEARLGWSWQPQPRWNLTAEVSMVDNRANIALYDYSRRQFSVGARYQFD